MSLRFVGLDAFPNQNHVATPDLIAAVFVEQIPKMKLTTPGFLKVELMVMFDAL